MATISAKEIRVYVREGGSDDERTMSFNPPEEIAQADLLQRGYAIDGRSAVYSVTADEDDTLVDNLRLAEEALVKWLSELGYRVTFV